MVLGNCRVRKRRWQPCEVAAVRGVAGAVRNSQCMHIHWSSSLVGSIGRLHWSTPLVFIKLGAFVRLLISTRYVLYFATDFTVQLMIA